MSGEFPLVETTIADIHEAMAAGTVTSQELVERYSERIAAYDRAGPELNGVVTVNDEAIDRAIELDQTFAESGPVGPLHGIPILVKDQAMTAGLTTTFGSVAFEEYVPEQDATIISHLRDAGAIILAKTNLPDWAAGFVGHSSVLGQTKNPYDLTRDSGGSSAGTGSGVAANLGAVGIGEDTGGSIRVPASCCNLFGIRVTTGLVSRHGLSPLVINQDTAGPMTRTVDDLARLLDVLVGYDPEDQWTGATAIADVGGYHEATTEADLDGVRIGVVRELFGDADDPNADPVTRCVDEALGAMADAGATLVDPVTVPDLDSHVEGTSLYALQSKHDIDGFLSSLSDPPADSVDAIHESGDYDKRLALFAKIVEGPDDPSDNPDYWQRVAAQQAFQRTLIATLADDDLDALAFPDVQVVPREYEKIPSGAASRDDYPTNTVVASQSSCPAISMPAGFSPEGLPVGFELLGAPYSERRLVSIAAAYEEVADPRRPPASMPALES